LVLKKGDLKCQGNQLEIIQLSRTKVCVFFSTWSKFYKGNSLRKFHEVNYVSILIRTPLTEDPSISRVMQRDTEKRVHTGIHTYIHTYIQAVPGFRTQLFPEHLKENRNVRKLSNRLIYYNGGSVTTA
jgi:hypothetical protein